MSAPHAFDRPQVRVFLVGYYGTHNAGDEAIRDAVEAAAATLGVDVAHYATRDSSVTDSPRAVPVHGLGLWRYVRALVTADRIVLGGGGILKDEGMRLPLELFATALCARLLRKQVSLLAVGVGPLYSRPGAWLVTATARLANVRTVRDVASARSLRSLGVARVEVGADPTYATAPREARSSPAADGPRSVLVSLRPWFLREPDRDTRQQRLRDAVSAGLQELGDRGWDATLAGLYWPRDHAESVELASVLRFDHVTVLDHELDWPALLDLARTADLVVAMRYHAVVAASIQSRPMIALAYEPKVASLAAELGIPVVDVADPDVGAKLGRAVHGWLDGREPCRPDPAKVALLRRRAWRSLAWALSGIDPGEVDLVEPHPG